MLVSYQYKKKKKKTFVPAFQEYKEEVSDSLNRNNVAPWRELRQWGCVEVPDVPHSLFV